MKVYDKKSQNEKYFNFDQKRQVFQTDMVPMLMCRSKKKKKQMKRTEVY